MKNVDRSGCQAQRHGTRSAYGWWGCRCPDAREAHRLYHKRLRYGRQPAAHLPAVGTTRRLQALVAAGYTWTALAGHLGVSCQRVRAIAFTVDGLVHPATSERVREVFGQLATVPGSSKLARTVAARYGWAPPMAWDDDTIDDPHARPTLGDDVDDRTVVDRVAIERALAGERVPLNRLERHHAIHAGLARGIHRQTLSTTLRIAWSEIKRLEATPLPDGGASEDRITQQPKERAA